MSAGGVAGLGYAGIAFLTFFAMLIAYGWSDTRDPKAQSSPPPVHPWDRTDKAASVGLLVFVPLVWPAAYFVGMCIVLIGLGRWLRAKAARRAEMRKAIESRAVPVPLGASYREQEERR